MDEQQLQKRRWFALAVLSGSLLVISLDNTILNVAIPSLVRNLNATTSQLQWIIDGYTLVFAGLLLTAGAMGDRFGRKGALQLGLVIFGLASMASGMAQSSNQLIVTRSLMGIGAALIMPSTLSLLTNIFHDPRERAKAIGVWAAVAGASGALGPVIGGLLLKWFSWHAVFFVNVPVIIVLLLAGRSFLPKSKAEIAERLDPLGAVLSIIGFVLVLWAVIESPTKGITDSTVVMVFSVGVLAVAAFIIWELRIDHPMLNMRFFKNPRFTAANMAVTLVYFAMFGQMFVMNQYTQVVLGYSPLEAGFRMMPMSIVMNLRRADGASFCASDWYETRCRRWSRCLLDRCADRFDGSCIKRVPGVARRHCRAGLWYGLCHGAGHRISDGLIATRKSRCRIGDE